MIYRVWFEPENKYFEIEADSEESALLQREKAIIFGNWQCEATPVNED